ncbi:MAG: C2 domain-containing protein [Hyphomicrobiaceae bacterium]
MPIFGDRGSALCAKKIAGAALVAMMCGAAVPAAADEIIVTVDSLQALDRIDPGGGPADFYAQVTIAGQVYRSPAIRRADVVRPNWTFSKRVRPGTYDVKLEIFDKDVFSKDDQIDINRLDGKRDLDFRVRTRPCQVLDFAEPYACRGHGVTITRAGRENKSAEIRFTVDTHR